MRKLTKMILEVLSYIGVVHLDGDASPREDPTAADSRELEDLRGLDAACREYDLSRRDNGKLVAAAHEADTLCDPLAILLDYEDLPHLGVG
jgi:hypothetical protein